MITPATHHYGALSRHNFRLAPKSSIAHHEGECPQSSGDSTFAAIAPTLGFPHAELRVLR